MREVDAERVREVGVPGAAAEASAPPIDAPLDWPAFRRILSGRRLPAAVVDVSALERNVDRVVARLAGSGKGLRVASKSVRHVGLLRRILARGGDSFRGLMCYSAEEAASLHGEGFDDLLVAYPTLQPAALDALAAVAGAGGLVRTVVDCRDHLRALGAAGERAGVVMAAVLELDVSYRPFGGAFHLGARRSPVRDVGDLVALARAASDVAGVRVDGLMAYEAHVAGVQDASPFHPLQNPLKRWFKAQAVPAVASLRAEAVAALRAEGFDLPLVNGGGTGSLSSTAREDAVTEVTAGSGFLCPHLFSAYRDLDLEPAAWFALEVARIPDPGYVTCAGGGYVASGEPGWDRLPVPAHPPGLSFVPAEGAGEVQTPLRTSAATPPLAVGDPILFRHAKAGELAERFNEFLLVRSGNVVAREPTYRGAGWCFL